MSRRDLEQRLANTTWSRPPSDVPMATCWCGGAWLDTELGADSHEVVMGHRPARHHDKGGEPDDRDNENSDDLPADDRPQAG